MIAGRYLYSAGFSILKDYLWSMIIHYILGIKWSFIIFDQFFEGKSRIQNSKMQFVWLITPCLRVQMNVTQVFPL